MKQNLLKKMLPLSMAVCALTLGSCADLDLPETAKGEENVNITDYLMSLPLAPGMARAGAPVNPDDGQPIPIEDDFDSQVEPGKDNLDGIPGYWVKTSRKYKMSQSFDENILFDPTGDMIYPGCVLKGSSIADGTYAMISDCKTGDVTFSINLVPANPKERTETSATIPNIRKSEYQEVWNKWANMDWKESPVTTIESIDKINSETELITKLGAAVKSPIADGALNFGFNFKNKKQHILARLIQKSFSVSTDAPKSGTIFETINKNYLDGYQPVYVSNINYGRIIYLCIDTDEKENDVHAAIEFAMKKIKGTDIDVSADVETRYKNILAKCDIRILMFGGGKTLQQKVLQGELDGFQRYLQADIPMEQMHPISFSLRYASDNSQARVITSNEFTITQRDFIPDFNKVRMTMRVLGFSGFNNGPLPNLDYKANLWGKVSVKINENETELINFDKDNSFWFNYRETPEVMHEVGKGGYETIDFERNPNDKIQDFIDHQKITFITDLHTAAQPYNYDYGYTAFNHTLGTVYSVYKSNQPIVRLECAYGPIKIHTYVQIYDMKFF